MKRTRHLAAVPALVFLAQLFAGSASAVPVDYDEPGPGSEVGLGNNDDGQVVTGFDLEVGSNTISGNATAGGTGSDDFDDMILTVGPGQTLTSATFSWTVNTGFAVQSEFRLHKGTTVSDPLLQEFDVTLIPTSGAGAMQMFALSLGAGTYLLDQISIGFLGTTPADFNYTWTFTVVPLPPAVWLFLSGLLAMVGLQRRRQRPVAG